MSNCYLYHLVRRFRGAIRFARTSTATNEAGAMQQVQITHNPFEALDTYRFQLYGFASAMPVGTDVVVINCNGDTCNGAVVGFNNQALRPKGMTEGESQIHDATGQYVYLKSGGEVQTNAGTEVVVSIGGNPSSSSTPTASP